MKIESTTDYSLFSVINGNRVINKKKVERLMQDIEAGLNLLPYCPIIVYQDEESLLRIVDGQHRFTTSQQLGLPVYYVLCEPLTLKQIARLNSRSDKWSDRNFLDCYIKLDLQDYIELQAFIHEYHIIISVAVDLLMYNKARGPKNSMEQFRDGEFEVRYLEEATKLVELVRSLFGIYVFSCDRNLIQAIQELQDKGLCDFEQLATKVKAAPMMMDKQKSVKEYIYNIERVYNHSNQKRQIIF